MGTMMPPPRAEIGQRWWIEGLGWRVIRNRRSDKHGALYGVRDGRCPEYPLGPVSATRERGRFLRSRSLRRRDKRVRSAYPNRYSSILRRIEMPVGFGEKEPLRVKLKGQRNTLLGDNESPVGRYLNRRIMVLLYTED